jgi:hypothetical protein
MPRPELYPVKKVIGFEQEMLDAIDKWRRKQTPIPTVSDAIRRLVELGLAVAPRQRGPHKGAAKAKEMAGEQLDRMVDPATSPEERLTRKRRLLKGPSEFRDMRTDLPKRKV